MARKPHVPGQLGLFRPESDWVRPTELPDLRGRPVVAIDTENRDDGLGTGRGPGWALGPLGYICGVSWAAEDSVGYAPVRHPDSDCFDPANVIRWVDDLFRSGTTVVFHNAGYDWGWLSASGVRTLPSRIEDTSCAAVMDEENHREYNLDACCRREGVEGKDESLLREAVRAYGGDPGKPQASIWRLPARYAAPYAEQDARATLELWGVLEPRLRAQKVHDAYRTEMELVPMIVEMRRRGIRIDADACERARAEFNRRRDAALAEITRRMPPNLLRRDATIADVNSPLVLARLFGAVGVSHPMTAGTATRPPQPSFQAKWLEKHDHWLPRLVRKAREYENCATKFVDNYLLSYAHRGRIHAEVHQFRTDDGGTRSQRFSYAAPPLQQMTAPEDEVDARDAAGELVEDHDIGHIIRGCILPERGQRWVALDYSSQEPRLTVHFAALLGCPGADVAVAKYQENPRLDYHQMVADMIGRKRKPAKILNLAMTYNKGKASTAAELGVSMDEAEKIIKEYHERLPFIGPLDKRCKNAAASRGYIKLIDGARMHYPFWEGGYMPPAARLEASRAGHRIDPCSREEAERRQADPSHPWSHDTLRRADSRKSLNNLVQGSAARQTKLAMLQMWREGILPVLQMHDEVDISADEPSLVARAEQIMVEATPLRVPTIVDVEVGPSWGEAHFSWEECEKKFGRLS